MDGHHFDRLAKALARGASRRSALKGLLAGAVGGAFSQLRVDLAHAQCSWSGIFQTTFGDMIVTLNESGGQVTGSYTFTENTATTNGTISGTVRSDSPGSTVLDGTWREPGQGGQLRFRMALDPCTEFTGSYTTAPSDAWKPGWDGSRIAEGGATSGEATIFTNPGDTRVAAFTVEGQVVTVFGPKNADGLVERINHAQVDSPDGDPQKMVFLDFDESGTSSRATLGSGEQLHFEWVSPTRVVIIYQNADGSQQTQFPYDFEAADGDGASANAHDGATHALESSRARTLTYSAHSGPGWLQTELREAEAAVQAPVSNRGIIEVQCADGQLVNADVRGGFWNPMVQTPVGGETPINFTPAGRGIFEYTLPLTPAPPEDKFGFVESVYSALKILCLPNWGMLGAAVVGAHPAEAICAFLAPVAGVAGCLAVIGSYEVVCGLSAEGPQIFKWIDMFTGSDLNVIAGADHPKLGKSAPIEFGVQAGEEIDKQFIKFQQVAGIDLITIEPPDPGPGQNYSVYADTVCAPPGTELTFLVRGSDGYFNSTVESLTETVTGGTLYVQGGAQGVYDEITIQLCCGVQDATDRRIVF